MLNFFSQHKKLLIFTLAIIAVSITTALFIFFKNKIPETILSGAGLIDKEKEAEEAKKKEDQLINRYVDKIDDLWKDADKKNEDYFNKNRYKKIVVARFYKINQDDCRKIKDADLQLDCLSYIKYIEILNEKEISKCELLEGEWRDMCIYQMNTNNKIDWNYCKIIKDNLLHDMCLNHFAITMEYIAICDESFKGKQGCVDRVKSASNGLNGNIKNCGDIVKAEYFINCINSSDGGDCSLMGDEYAVNRCKSVKHFTSILENGDKEDCAIMPLEEWRRSCEMYFDNEEKDSDYDGDGVNNFLELFGDTNPLIAGEDAMISYNNEKRYSEVFNSIYYKTESRLRDLSLDTDDDGLRDYEEKEIYKTDYKKQDTDDDGYLDGEEVKNGYNPLQKQ